MKVIAKFNWDCGRMGCVDGILVTTVSELESAYGKNVYFGEILGKHSNVYGVIAQCDFTILSSDQDFIAKFVQILGDGTISGYNPLDYIEE